MGRDRQSGQRCHTPDPRQEALTRNTHNRADLETLYATLFGYFGAQHWWPGESRFEVCAGAILTQNTNWSNVEKAIVRLKKHKLLSPVALRSVRLRTLASAIRPSGYFNQKAERLKIFSRWFGEYLDDSFDSAKGIPAGKLREELLSLKGIGPETADSMLLYAFNRTVFVVDAYTKRLVERHGYLPEGASYNEIQVFFEDNLPRKRRLYNEFHALIVRVGNQFCGPVPRCSECPASCHLLE